MSSQTLVGLSRGWRFILGAALALLFWVLAAASFLPLSLRVSGLWLVLLLGGGLVLRADAWWEDAELLPRIGSLLLVSCGWDLLVLFLVHLSGGGLRVGLLVLSLSLPVLALSPWPRRFPPPRVSWRSALLLLAVFGILFIHLTRQTPQLALDSDVPAHLGSIHDALQQNRFLPLDGSFPGAPAARDPRMGILHGLHAALAEALLADPARVWGLSGGILSLMFLLCFAWLFFEWGLSRWLALVAAFLMAAGAGGGAALGLWGAVYPAQFALALAAACGAWFLRSLGEDGGRVPWWPAGLALALSVLVHPFAWWGSCLILAHLLLLSWIARRPKEESWVILRFLALAVLLGGALILPLLLQQSGSTGQWQRAGVLVFGRKFFVMDPLIVLRWSGILGPGAILFALWRWRRWRGSLSGLFVVASVLPIWTITFNPLLQPFVFAHCGYLSERLGLFAAGPAVVLLALLPRADAAWTSPRRVIFGGILLVMLWGSWTRITFSPYRESQDVVTRLDRLRTALRGVEGTILADPRTSYALRGMRGGEYPILPVAHASPLDNSIERKMALYRRLLARECAPEEFTRARDGLQASAILFMTQLESEYDESAEYGFVPSNRRQVALLDRLRKAGVVPRAVGDDWELFDSKDLAIKFQAEIPDSTSCGIPDPERVRGGKTLRLMSLQALQDQVSPGDSLAVQLCYGANLDSRVEPGWTRVELRFLGHEQPVPNPLLGVSKLYRKLILEKSLRSSSRFTVSFHPNQGYPRAPKVWGEVKTVVVPSWIKAGRYQVSARVEQEQWRPVRTIADYLDDRAQWSGESLGEVTVRQAKGAER